MAKTQQATKKDGGSEIEPKKSSGVCYICCYYVVWGCFAGDVCVGLSNILARV